ncbi:MAG: sodium:solute symporter family protein [Pirellulales bacterium]|nr:sodium:solute symporter family protein [Pirellulales bacterium]
MQSGLSGLDFTVIGVYFAVIIGIGIWSARRIKNQEDYFLAGRRFGKFIQTFACFGAGTNVESPVGVATTTFTNGAAGIWSSLVYLFVTPLYWLIAPWMRRLRVLTMADYFEERYGSRAIAGLYTVVAAVVMMAHLSVGFSAASKTVMAMAPKSQAELTAAERAELARADELRQLQNTDCSALSAQQRIRFTQLEREAPRRLFSHVNQHLLIWIICAVVMIYGIAGGLTAAALTDTVQGLCIIFMSLMLFPFCWAKINGVYGGSGMMDALQTMHARLPESFFEILGSPTLPDFTWYYIVALSLLAVSNTPPQAHFLTSNASARNEYASRFGATTGSYIKRFCAVLWGFFALGAIVVFYDKIHDPDMLWGYASYHLLGPIGMGLVGLMIACLMAALMSTASMLMLTSSALLTKNVYRPLFPHHSERHYVLVGRLLGGVVIVAGALVATQFDTILQLLKFMWEINVMIAATWWLGMKWRRANRAGAWSSMAVAAIFFFLLPVLLPICRPALRCQGYLLKSTQVRSNTRTYHAHAMDVEQRQKEIAGWEALTPEQKRRTPKPLPLTVGEKFKKSVPVPAKSIFWTQGIKLNDQGTCAGTGMLNLELVALDLLGFPLEKNTYALNETVRILIRTILPFLILIGVSLLTRPEDRRRLDRFFAKMKTEVREDRAADQRELDLSYAQPDRFDHRKLFPKTQWEFHKWNRVDTVGFILSSLIAFSVLGFLKLLLLIGS